MTHNLPPSLSHRLLGAFWGLITGDALGAPVEFYQRDRFPLVRDMQSGGNFSYRQGLGRMTPR